MIPSGKPSKRLTYYTLTKSEIESLIAAALPTGDESAGSSQVTITWDVSNPSVEVEVFEVFK
jgi:hypothetical protein